MLLASEELEEKSGNDSAANKKNKNKKNRFKLAALKLLEGWKKKRERKLKKKTAKNEKLSPVFKANYM